ncbi:MAG: hypothetical protein QXM83_02445, partial [Ignisphaera sp.]
EVELRVGRKTKRLFLLPEHVKPAFDVNERIKETLIKLKELGRIRELQREQMISLLSQIK